MSITLSESLVSASSRPMSVRIRPDLVTRQHLYQGTSYWIVKDPVGLNYVRLQEDEYAILQMLDGRVSLDDIKQFYEAKFRPSRITEDEIARFIGSLFQSGLLIADVPGQGEQLKKRNEEYNRKKLKSVFSNILAIRFKGIDPERMLNWLYPKTAWFFSKPMVYFCLAMAVSALLLVTVQWDEFQSKLPTFHTFFAGKNWIWLGVTLAITKVLHEFGHGLSCKHYGGECHEMGVMILVLTPCLYCNVSDSWMLPNKWQRAAIGAAGMYVELVIASIATFIWWNTIPDTILNQLCLSIMFVCSVSTLIFNGNPLLRYDGYYILADILEIPNLRQKSSSILNRKLGEICLGLEPPEDPFLPQCNQAMFALYSIAAVLYRWLVVFGILFFLFQVFEGTGFEVIGQIIAVFSLFNLFIMPLWKFGKFLAVPGRLQQVKRARLNTTLAVIAVIVAGVIFLPLPHHVICTLEIEPHDATEVLVEVPGTIEQILVRGGTTVQKGDPLVQLRSLDLELEAVRIQGEIDVLQAQQADLHYQRNLGDAVAARRANEALLEVRERIDSTSKRLKHAQQDIERLTLYAPRSGYIFPPPLHSGESENEGGLPTWSGTPLDPKNKGAYLQANDLFCMIGEQTDMEAALAIDQSDRNFVLVKQPVEIKLDHLPGHTFESTIDHIATDKMKEAPARLSDKADGELMTETDESGREKPISATYKAIVLINDTGGQLRIGLRGRAKIHTDPRTLGDRLWRLLSETFNFKF
ncbi:MAG: biotin/lipoyl-binding protein [Planctomycetales bacterium]